MKARTCEDIKHVKDIGETTKFNQYVLKNGLMEVAQKYVPPWFHFNPFVAIAVGQIVKSIYSDHHKHGERVRLANHEGNIILDVFEIPKQTQISS